MSLRIAISGSTGLIGRKLMSALSENGHALTPIVRQTTPLKFNRKVIRWNIENGKIDNLGLEGYDVVIHLAGVSIAGARWTPGYKKMIKDSRLKSTTLLSHAIAQLKKPPRLLLSASAVGYYGQCAPNEKKDESNPAGAGFLPELCQQWEMATETVAAKGIRVVHMRFGVVLSKAGGALAQMLPVFNLGLGGKIGTGTQMMSWIALDEIPLIVSHIIQSTGINGAVNFVAPQSVSNLEFTRVLGQALHRPAIFPLPVFGAKMMFGEMADSLLLNSLDVAPKKLTDSGYSFAYPDLKSALQKTLSPVSIPT